MESDRVVLAIDPGTTHSGYVLYNDSKYPASVLESVSQIENDRLINQAHPRLRSDHVAIEMVANYGMEVGKSTFETVLWIGRMYQAFGPDKSQLVYRKDVKLFLCNNFRAKDKNIRRAILNVFPAAGGGKTPQVGTKAKPGPLYGVSGHAWSALAIALTVAGRNIETVLQDSPELDYF